MSLWQFTGEGFPYLHNEGKRAKTLNHTTGLARNINCVNRDDLGEEYRKLTECAPRRAKAGKCYFRKTHRGIPSESSSRNRSTIKRHEEHLAMALWNLKNRWSRDDGNQFCLLDYQFPLKTNRSDLGIGKVDLLGVTEQGRLMVIELKVKNRKNNGRGDNPMVALLEGLRYTAIVQANLNCIAGEIEQKFDCSIQIEPPVVQVLAPEDWWKAWMELKSRTRSAAGNWERAFARLAKDIEERIGISIECAALNVKRGQVSFDEDCRPRLDRTPELRILSLCAR